MTQIRNFKLSGVIFFAILLCVAVVFYYDFSTKNPVDSREIFRGDKDYDEIWRIINIQSPDFLYASQGNIRFIKITAKNNNCVFLFADPPIGYSDDDFIYCSKKGGNGLWERF